MGEHESSRQGQNPRQDLNTLMHRHGVTIMMEKSRILSARRAGLMAGVAALSATILLGAGNVVPNAPGSALSSLAYAQNVQRPVGFADIVEKVKPAVISVRVKLDSGAK